MENKTELINLVKRYDDMGIDEFSMAKFLKSFLTLARNIKGVDEIEEISKDWELRKSFYELAVRMGRIWWLKTQCPTDYEESDESDERDEDWMC